jgi:AraC-like DNA-binding protein
MPRYLRHVPRAPLSEYVNLLWLYEGYTQPHAKERILPTGEMQIVINLREDRTCMYDPEDPARCRTFRGALFSGAHSQYQVIDTAEQESVIGVHFRPGGAFPFLRMPAGELRDATVGLDDLWGASAGELRDRLLEAATAQARIAILEEVLMDRLLRRCDRHGAVSFAMRRFLAGPQVTTIASVTGQVGLSPKRFIQVFRDETGFTPKVFCRIRRFQQALDHMEGRKRVDWTNVALDCGYFDQAHFIHDFRAFSGINPSTYLAQQTPHRNHVPLTD